MSVQSSLARIICGSMANTNQPMYKGIPKVDPWQRSRRWHASCRGMWQNMKAQSSVGHTRPR